MLSNLEVAIIPPEKRTHRLSSRNCSKARQYICTLIVSKVLVRLIIAVHDKALFYCCHLLLSSDNNYPTPTTRIPHPSSQYLKYSPTAHSLLITIILLYVYFPLDQVRINLIHVQLTSKCPFSTANHYLNAASGYIKLAMTPVWSIMLEFTATAMTGACSGSVPEGFVTKQEMAMFIVQGCVFLACVVAYLVWSSGG